MSDAIVAETITMTGHGGDEIEAYFARPVHGIDQAGVVVLHHMPGYDRPPARQLRGPRTSPRHCSSGTPPASRMAAAWSAGLPPGR